MFSLFPFFLMLLFFSFFPLVFGVRLEMPFVSSLYLLMAVPFLMNPLFVPKFFIKLNLLLKMFGHIISLFLLLALLLFILDLITLIFLISISNPLNLFIAIVMLPLWISGGVATFKM